MKKEIIIKINSKDIKKSNEWHFLQQMKGSKIHKSKKRMIPREDKYKEVL